MTLEAIIGLITALCCSGGIIYLAVDKKIRQKDSDATIIHTMTESMTSMLSEMKDNRLEMAEQREEMAQQRQEMGDLRSQVIELGDKVTALNENLTDFGCLKAHDCIQRIWDKQK